VGIRGIYKLLGAEPILADWFTGVLKVPRGEILHYVHGDFLSIYEKEVRVKIENGVVIDSRVIDNRPHSGPAAKHYEQGQTWSLKGDYEKAIAAFIEAVRLHPNYADVYYVRALAYEAIGDCDRSLADLRDVIRLQPGAIQVRCTMTQFISSRESLLLPMAWESARNYIDRDISHVCGRRGMAYLQNGEYATAIADLTESIELDPKSHVRLARGRAYCALRRFKEAIDDLTAVSVTNPKDERVRFDIYYLLANCYGEIRSFEQARFHAGIAIRLAPNNPEAHFLRGSAYLENGDYNQAVSDLTEVIRLRAGWTEAYVERAKAYRALGNETKSAADVTKAEQLRSIEKKPRV
jgi:tetratricopeptide (TPR) repeat protein